MPTPEIIQTIIDHLNLLKEQGKYLQLIAEIFTFTSMPLGAAAIFFYAAIESLAKSKKN